MTITITAAKKTITMSTTTTVMAMVATLEASPPPHQWVVLGLPRFAVAVVESPSVISGPPAVVMSVVLSLGEVVSCVGASVGSGVVASLVVASMVFESMVVASMAVASMVVASVVASSVEHKVC